MEQPPEGTPDRLSEYLTRYFNSLILSVNALKDTVRIWKASGFTGTFTGNLTGNVTGNLTGNTTGNVTTSVVKFPATQVVSADANTLDDYQENTFNPVVTPATGAITTYTSSGSYTKLGNMVSFHFTVNLVNRGTGAGALHVTLPFTCVSWSCGVARDSTTGNMCQVVTSGAYVSVLFYNNASVITTGNVLIGTFIYQAAS
jgi:hypothetical protein